MDHQRRLILTGAAAMAATPSWATTPRPPAPAKLFTTGVLARNMLAQEFNVPAQGLNWPEKMRLLGPGRTPVTIDDYRGKTLVVNLWAEWCPPCLLEMEGFAIMDRRVRTDAFQIITILTGSNFREVEDARPLMKKLRSENLPVLMDASPGKALLMRRLTRSRQDPSGALPCTLVVDAAGVIRGRMIGSTQIGDDLPRNAKDADAKSNIWRTNIALQFVTALAEGALV
jgi:thiol-disulfide isomerase/thioredoxin